MAERIRSHATFDFDSVARQGNECAAWLDELRTYGLTLLKGARGRTGELQRLTASLNLPLRRTVYGEGGAETFHVWQKPSPNNQAYTEQALPLHTDLPFYRRPPDVQMLHCVAQDEHADGGASVFADGQRAALLTQRCEAHPDDFGLLASTPVKSGGYPEDICPSRVARESLLAVSHVFTPAPSDAL